MSLRKNAAFKEPEENVPVFGFVGRSGKTDDVYINAHATCDVSY